MRLRFIPIIIIPIIAQGQSFNVFKLGSKNDFVQIDINDPNKTKLPISYNIQRSWGDSKAMLTTQITNGVGSLGFTSQYLTAYYNSKQQGFALNFNGLSFKMDEVGNKKTTASSLKTNDVSANYLKVEQNNVVLTEETSVNVANTLSYQSVERPNVKTEAVNVKLDDVSVNVNRTKLPGNTTLDALSILGPKGLTLSYRENLGNIEYRLAYKNFNFLKNSYLIGDVYQFSNGQFTAKWYDELNRTEYANRYGTFSFQDGEWGYRLTRKIGDFVIQADKWTEPLNPSVNVEAYRLNYKNINMFYDERTKAFGGGFAWTNYTFAFNKNVVDVGMKKSYFTGGAKFDLNSGRTGYFGTFTYKSLSVGVFQSPWERNKNYWKIGLNTKF